MVSSKLNKELIEQMLIRERSTAYGVCAAYLTNFGEHATTPIGRASVQQCRRPGPAR